MRISADPDSSTPIPAWQLWALFSATFAAYLPIWRNAFFSDDLVFITQNPALTHVWPIGRFFLDRATTSNDPMMNHLVYRPLASIVFAAINAVVGFSPELLHGLNLSVHILNSYLVLRLARRLLRNSPSIAPFLAAMVFALHPVQVEAVAWAVHFSDLGSAAFLLLGLNVVAERPDAIAWIFACNVISVFFKESGVVFPALAAVVLALTSADDRKPWWRAAVHPSVIGGLALLAAFVPFRAHVVGQFSQEAAWAGPGRVFMLMTKSFAYYVKLCLIPYPLSQTYLFRIPRAPWDPLFLLSLAVLGTLVAIAAFQWRKRKIISAGIAWWFIALSPVSGVFTVSSSLNERFLYVAVIGFALIASSLCCALIEDEKARIGAATAVLFAYGLIVATRLPDWRDQRSSVLATLRTCPQDQFYRGAYANDLRGHGRFRDAAIEYLRAIAVEPAEHQKLLQTGLLTPQEDKQFALRSYPDIKYRTIARLYCELGTTFRALGVKDRTIAALQECRQKDPAYPSVYRNLAVAYFEAGDSKRSIEYFQRQLRHTPDDNDSRRALEHLLSLKR